jgi:hypothetical protein
MDVSTPRRVRRADECLRRRRANLLKKAFELNSKSGAKVYVVVEGKRECYVFNSEDGSSWPPSDQELVRKVAP